MYQVSCSVLCSVRSNKTVHLITYHTSKLHLYHKVSYSVASFTSCLGALVASSSLTTAYISLSISGVAYSKSEEIFAAARVLWDVFLSGKIKQITDHDIKKPMPYHITYTTEQQFLIFYIVNFLYLRFWIFDCFPFVIHHSISISIHHNSLNIRLGIPRTWGNIDWCRCVRFHTLWCALEWNNKMVKTYLIRTGFLISSYDIIFMVNLFTFCLGALVLFPSTLTSSTFCFGFLIVFLSLFTTA